ncbi:MAG TPA: polyhydroxyalkanoate synthesis repressor PhaR [Usitatibacteraceae bacterium]
MARIIKKYPNRRLYDTETSAYITLTDVKQFVLDLQQFEVHDARTGEDLTRSILLQVILEEESGGVPMFSSDMLANIIRYYGHAMQGLMGSYLERSIGAFHEAQKKFQEQSTSVLGAAPAFTPDAWSKLVGGAGTPMPAIMNDYLEKSASSVIGMQDELRKQAMQMFSSFPYSPMAAGGMSSAKSDAGAVAGKAKSAAAKPSAKKKRSA